MKDQKIKLKGVKLSAEEDQKKLHMEITKLVLFYSKKIGHNSWCSIAPVLMINLIKLMRKNNCNEDYFINTCKWCWRDFEQSEKDLKREKNDE